MSAETVEEFARLWTSEAGKYVLVFFQIDGTGPQYRIIFNKDTRMATLIEDPEMASEVMRRMAEAGVEIVDKLPVSDRGK